MLHLSTLKERKTSQQTTSQKLRCVGLYDTLVPEEGGKEFGYIMFKDSPHMSMEQNEPTVNQVQHVPIIKNIKK